MQTLLVVLGVVGLLVGYEGPLLADETPSTEPEIHQLTVQPDSPVNVKDFPRGRSTRVTDPRPHRFVVRPPVGPVVLPPGVTLVEAPPPGVGWLPSQ